MLRYAVTPLGVGAGSIGLDGFASSTTGGARRSSQPADGGTIVKTAQEAIKGAVRVEAAKALPLQKAGRERTRSGSEAKSELTAISLAVCSLV